MRLFLQRRLTGRARVTALVGRSAPHQDRTRLSIAGRLLPTACPSRRKRVAKSTCGRGGIGRRKGLKIPRWQRRVGSSPTARTSPAARPSRRQGLRSLRMTSLHVKQRHSDTLSRRSLRPSLTIRLLPHLAITWPRAQGRPGAWPAPMAPVRTKCTGQEPQAWPMHPGLPCTDGFNDCFVLSPGNGFFAPVCGDASPHHHSAPAPRRQDHTTSPSASATLVDHGSPRPPHLTATSVTIASRPSFG